MKRLHEGKEVQKTETITVEGKEIVLINYEQEYWQNITKLQLILYYQSIVGFSQRYQEEVLKTYCAINSIQLGKIVFEDYSAKTFNRPAWNKLFAEYRSKKLSTPRLLLVTKWIVSAETRVTPTI